jgi:hypothetical protein
MDAAVVANKSAETVSVVNVRCDGIGNAKPPASGGNVDSPVPTLIVSTALLPNPSKMGAADVTAAPDKTTPDENTNGVVGPVGPITVEAAPVGPVNVEAAPGGPVTVEAAPVGPVTVEAAPVGPVTVEAAPVGPVTVEVAPVGPVTVEVAPVGPVTVTAAPVGPVGPVPVIARGLLFRLLVNSSELERMFDRVRSRKP